MKFHVVINPAAAGGATLRMWNRVKPMFAAVEYEVHQSTKEIGIREIVHQLTTGLSEEINLVIIGGDGTMNDVVNGIADFTHTRVGLIPCGSGNDLVRDMALPEEITDLVERMIHGRVMHETNVCQTTFPDDGTKRKFLVSSGFGFDAEVCQEVAVSKLKNVLNRLNLGSLVYIIIAFGILKKKERFTLTFGDENYPETMFVSMQNHQYEGGGFRFGPNARFDDGLLDLCVVHHVNVVKFLQLFLKAYDGSHIKYHQHVSQHRTSCIMLEADHAMWVHCDGEPLRKAERIQVEVLEETLKCLM